MAKKIKQRPRRLFYDDKKDKYFYLIKGKKKYIKPPTKTITTKEVSRINIRNIIPVPVRVRNIRPKGSLKAITNERIVSKAIPVSVSQNIIPSLYRTGDDFEKRLTKIEDKFKPVEKKPETKKPETNTGRRTGFLSRFLPSRTPKPTSSSVIAKEREETEKQIMKDVDKQREENKQIQGPTTNIADLPKSNAFLDFFRNKKSDIKEPPPIVSTKSMNSKNRDDALKKFNKNYKGELSVESYGDFLAFQSKDKVYSKYTPLEYDSWIRYPSFLTELEALPPEDRKELERNARLSYFAPLTTGSNIQVFNQGRFEDNKEDDFKGESKDEGRTSGFGQYENDDDGMYNDELQEIFEDKTNKFLPVIASDKMDTLLPLVNKDTKKFGWIQNTEPSGSMGRHWVAYFIDIPNYEVNYYDSLVENDGEPPLESLKGLKKIIDKIHPEYYLLFKYNQIRDQNYSSKNCGYFALKFIMDRYRNIPFKTATSYDTLYNYESDDETIDNSGAGEKMIKKFKQFL
jgi:hypothetical protein